MSTKKLTKCLICSITFKYRDKEGLEHTRGSLDLTLTRPRKDGTRAKLTRRFCIPCASFVFYSVLKETEAGHMALPPPPPGLEPAGMQLMKGPGPRPPGPQEPGEHRTPGGIILPRGAKKAH